MMEMILKNTLPLDRHESDVMGQEPYRPRFHFTPRRNWMNDPNGLVYFDGEYHLFYQYNPYGIQWGHMSWGHAVSTDLVHWQELPIAMPEREFMIFSGCALIDWNNVTGLGDGNAPPLIAFYTAYCEARLNQSQHLAFSHDRGRTWTHYSGNPLIDLDMEHFRDPNVFYHEGSAAWIMVVALAQEHRLQIYRSTNLLDWTLASQFGPAGSTGGQWECPDMFQVPVEGSDGGSRWVLKVDVDRNFVAGGSGAQYFVGEFDGYQFVIDQDQGAADGDFVDFGPDFYAAISWSDLPADQPGPVWIGWTSNHQCGRYYPTKPWAGAQSLPRQIFLFEEAGKYRFGQRPVADVQGLRGPRAEIAPQALALFDPLIVEPKCGTFELSTKLAFAPGTVVTVELSDDKGKMLSVKFDNKAGELTFERHTSTQVSSEDFARRMTTKLSGDTRSEINLFFDESLVEVFLDGGRRVYTACLFPTGEVKVSFTATAGVACLEAGGLWQLKRAVFHDL